MPCSSTSERRLEAVKNNQNNNQNTNQNNNQNTNQDQQNKNCK